ncbi:MAG: dTDP-4-dehydrorhamnose reductase [Candidatus Margulisiibacteriota bacterium]
MLLVTGARGMVGSYVEEVFDGEKLVMTDIPEMDVTDKDKVFGLVSKHKPDFVLHLAAETNVDLCETQIDHAYRVNAMGAYYVALACKKYGAKMIHISTGGVFNGKGRYVNTEFDMPDPQNIYSKAKYEGERLIKDLLNDFYIFRAGWMIGGGPKLDKKFVGKMIELFGAKDNLEVVNDKFGTPTFAKDLLEGIKKIIKTGNYGLYHLGNSGGSCTRYDIALEIAKIIGKKTQIIPVSSDRFPLPAPRAESEAMANYKLELMGQNPMPDWRKSLKAYISEWGK